MKKKIRNVIVYLIPVILVAGTALGAGVWLMDAEVPVDYQEPYTVKMSQSEYSDYNWETLEFRETTDTIDTANFADNKPTIAYHQYLKVENPRDTPVNVRFKVTAPSGLSEGMALTVRSGIVHPDDINSEIEKDYGSTEGNIEVAAGNSETATVIYTLDNSVTQTTVENIHWEFYEDGVVGANIPEYQTMEATHTESEIKDILSDGVIDSNDNVGDKIVFPDGTYDNFTVEVEDVTLASATKGGAVIDANGDEFGIDVAGTDAAGTITVKGFQVKGWKVGGIGQGYDTKDGTVTHFLHNDVDVHADGPSGNGNSIQATGNDSTVMYNDVEVTGYDHEDSKWNTSGILIGGTNVEVMHNIVKYVDNGVSEHQHAIAIENWENFDINFQGDNVKIAKNTVKCSYIGIAVEGPVDTAVIEYNHIENTDKSINVGTLHPDYTGTPVNVEAHYNNLPNGVYNNGDDTVDATYNWWGTTDSTAIESMIEGDVTYDPYLEYQLPVY